MQLDIGLGAALVAVPQFDVAEFVRPVVPFCRGAFIEPDLCFSSTVNAIAKEMLASHTL
jgi:hypothetical protein